MANHIQGNCRDIEDSENDINKIADIPRTICIFDSSLCVANKSQCDQIKGDTDDP
ncbi:hypothetical protein D3C71_1062210 [compost metagenome]